MAYALTWFEPADKMQLIGLARPHPEREVAPDTQTVRPGQFQVQGDIADRLADQWEAVEALAFIQRQAR